MIYLLIGVKHEIVIFIIDSIFIAQLILCETSLEGGEISMKFNFS